VRSIRETATKVRLEHLVRATKGESMSAGGMMPNPEDVVEKPAAHGRRNDEGLTADDLEFIRAIDAYKRKHSRPFPTWSEVLRILKGLGYRK
jgi:hypothetical protein